MTTIIQFTKIDTRAHTPIRMHSSDAGFDIAVIEQTLQNKNIQVYRTGLCVGIPTSHYLQIVPRSSLYKKGYLLANSVGIIDSGYSGEIFIVLYKFDETAPDLTLPSRIVQFIPRRQELVKFIETCEGQAPTQSGNRGEGGFGSTGD